MNSRWQQYYYYSLYSERVCQTKVFFKITVLKCSFYFNRVLINTTNIYFNIVTNVFLFIPIEIVLNSAIERSIDNFIFHL